MAMLCCLFPSACQFCWTILPLFPATEVPISNQVVLSVALFVQCLAQCAPILVYLLGSMPAKVTIY